MQSRVLIAAVAAAGLAGSALASDLPVRRAPPSFAVAVPAFTWTGFYVGGTAGAGFNESVSRLDPTGRFLDPAVRAPADLEVLRRRLGSSQTSFTGGGQVGYNHQVGALVFGVEADGSYLDFHRARAANTLTSYPVSGGLFPYITAQSQRIGWFATARARLGYAVTDRLMVYGTGGAAFGEVRSRALAFFPPGSGNNTFAFDRSSDRTGWTAGGGAEYALTANWSVKAEYLYVDLGRARRVATDTTGFAAPFGYTYTLTDEAQFHVARAGLNYRF